MSTIKTLNETLAEKINKLKPSLVPKKKQIKTFSLVPISMLRGCTESLAVETTHINDILRVRGIKSCFNEFLSNCLAFSRSNVNLRHCRQHCHIDPRLHCIRNPSFGIQASNFGHIKRRLPHIHLHEIQASQSKVQASKSKPAPASSNLHGESTLASSHPPPRNSCIEFRSHQTSMPVRRIHLQEIQVSHFGHFNPPSTSNRRRSMRSPSHFLHVIQICCKRWSRMRARARID